MKNVVITGSTRGIGLAMAVEFLKEGCNVTLSGRNKTLSEELKDQLKDFKDHFIYHPCNVQHKEELENLWSVSIKQWKTVDIWINNAGQNVPHDYCYETDEAHTHAVIDTNIKGVIFGSQVAAKQMLLQGHGQIFNMEGLGSNDMIQPKTILYGTSKRALTYFSKGLAKELDKTPVKVGRLSPGMMLTDFITKTPEGESSPVISDPRFKSVFNTLADYPETVAAFFIPRILANTKNDAHIVWLTSTKAMARFMSQPFVKRNLLK